MEQVTVNHDPGSISKLTPTVIDSGAVRVKISSHSLTHCTDNRHENSFYKYLDLEALINVFAQRLFCSFSICDMRFSQPDLDVTLYKQFTDINPENSGKKVNYNISYGNKSLGKLTIALTSKTTVFEKTLIDNRVDDLRGPLYNSIRFEQAFRSGYRDVLTGLYNRAALEELLFDQSAKDSNTSTVMVCDMDRFKWINDHYGHTTGDYALSQFSHKASAIVDENGKVFRYGGDEFVIALNTVSESRSAKLAEKVRNAAQSCLLHDGTSLTVTIGAAKVHCGENLKDTFSRADSALLYGKDNGSNKVVWFE